MQCTSRLSRDAFYSHPSLIVLKPALSTGEGNRLMDLRRLEVFCKLMETGSFSKTALELDLTQPTVSGHIKTLEQQIGLSLFDRHRRLVKPTGAAQVLYEYAIKILDLHQEAGYALQRFRGRISGRLTLGGSTIPGVYILPEMIGRFHNLHRETYLTLVVGDTCRIIDLATEGGVELGVVGARQEREDLAFEPLIDDELILAVPPDHKWTRLGRKVNISELPTVPFIIREKGSGTRTAMMKALSDRGLNLDDLTLVAEMGSSRAVCQAIKAGLGVSILSRVAVVDELRFNLLVEIPVEGLDLHRLFYLVYPHQRSQSPVCLAFIDFLRNEYRLQKPPDKELIHK